MVTSVPVKPLTGSLNTAVKLIGDLLVGSAWPAAWFFPYATLFRSKVTLLSVLVEAVLRLPAASLATPAAMEAITVPAVVMPETATLRSEERRVGKDGLVPPAAPLIVTSVPVKPLTGSLNTAVKLIGEALVGSA